MSQIDASYRKFYLREIDLLCLDLSITHIYSVENILLNSDRTWSVHRDVKVFMKKIERTKRKYQINASAIAQHCLRDFADAWFKSLVELIQKDLIKNFEYFCVKLIKIFDSVEQARQKKELKLLQQEVEETRIAKKQEEVRLTIFACKRCFVKFSSNTKLHQHIQNYHQKKFAKSASEFAIFSSNSESTSKAMFVQFTSNEFANSTLSEFAKFSSSFNNNKVMFFAKRCAFYISYSSTQYSSSSQLLNANFIFKRNSDISDQVYCEVCDIEFYEFRNDENSYQKHCEFSSTCSWIFAERASKSSTKAVLTSFATFSTSSIKTVSKSSLFVISFATSRKQLFWVEIVSRSIIASKSLRLSIATSRNASKVTKIASTTCSYTSSSISSRNSTSKHQKLYLIINDLFRMFAEKLKRTNLLHIRYQVKKHASSSCVFYQVKIIAYFKSAVNQSISISQNSKTSNSKSFRQRMFAKTIRIVLSLKSIKIFFIFNSCRVCSDTSKSNVDLQFVQNQSHSIKRFATVQRTFESAIASMTSLERLIERWNLIFLLLVCIIIKFLRWWITRLSSVTQRERCDLFRSMTLVTIKSSHRAEWVDRDFNRD